MDKRFWTAAELVERGVYAMGPARPTMDEATATLDAGVRLSMGIVRHEHALIPPAIRLPDSSAEWRRRVRDMTIDDGR